MFRNNGDGTFSDVSRQSGTDSPTTWGVSAAFVDVDRDGWLDLFVGNYLTYSLETHARCLMESGQEDYCAPGRYAPQQARFYRNRGGGKFVDATAAAGMARDFGPALGVSTADFNGDGWIDIFVANDQKENQLWINRGNGTFENRALRSGVALDGAGVAKANMGVDAGDFDNDGDEDLITTVLTREGDPLYVNDGTGLFEDRSMDSGIGIASRPYTGWGVAWIDVDNDGWLDLLAVNGLVKQDLDALSAGNPFPYQQRNQLLRNLGNGRFEDVTDRAGRVFALKAGRTRRGVRRRRQRWRCRRADRQQRRARAPADQRHRQPEPLARTAVGRQRPRTRYGRGARGGHPGRRTNNLAPCASGRKLRLGERSTGAGRARRRRRTYRACASSGRAGAPRSGPTCPPTATRPWWKGPAADENGT